MNILLNIECIIFWCLKKIINMFTGVSYSPRAFTENFNLKKTFQRLESPATVTSTITWDQQCILYREKKTNYSFRNVLIKIRTIYNVQKVCNFHISCL